MASTCGVSTKRQEWNLGFFIWFRFPLSTYILWESSWETRLTTKLLNMKFLSCEATASTGLSVDIRQLKVLPQYWFLINLELIQKSLRCNCLNWFRLFCPILTGGSEIVRERTGCNQIPAYCGAWEVPLYLGRERGWPLLLEAVSNWWSQWSLKDWNDCLVASESWLNCVKPAQLVKPGVALQCARTY